MVLPFLSALSLLIFSNIERAIAAESAVQESKPSDWYESQRAQSRTSYRERYRNASQAQLQAAIAEVTFVEDGAMSGASSTTQEMCGTQLGLRLQVYYCGVVHSWATTTNNNGVGLLNRGAASYVSKDVLRGLL